MWLFPNYFKTTHVFKLIVSEVSEKDVSKYEVLLEEKEMKLVKDGDFYKPLLKYKTKYYIIGNMSSFDESIDYFKNSLPRINDFIQNFPELANLGSIQKIANIILDNKGYKNGHIAVLLGLVSIIHSDSMKNSLNDIDETEGKTPIMISIENKNMKILHHLLKEKVSLSINDFYGNNPLHYAVSSPDSSFVKQVAKNCTKEELNHKNDRGMSPFHEGCRLNKPNSLQELLNFDVNPSLNTIDPSPLHVAVQSDSFECVKFLLIKYPKLKNVKDSNGNTPLHFSQNKEILNYLLDLGCKINNQNNLNFTPLLSMIVKANYDSSLMLLIRGADPLARDNSQEGPLHLAIKEDSLDLVKLLIVFGADLNLCNKNGVSPRHLAANSNGKNGTLILWHLDKVGAVRCLAGKKFCNDGCSSKGSFRGTEPSNGNRANVIYENGDETFYPHSGVMEAAILRSMAENSLRYANESVNGDRLLCLDGGGIRGLISLQILKAIEHVTGKKMNEMFDWIAGTSTGGIIAACLSMGLPLSRILSLYFQLKDKVFQGKRPYDKEYLEAHLKEVFGNTKMADIKKPKLLLLSVLSDRIPAQLHVFRNFSFPGIPHDPVPSPFKQFNNIPPPSDQLIWEAVRSSGSAPTFFRAHGRFIDGGLISNNPTLDALTEINKYYNAFKSIPKNSKIPTPPLHVVISIGTGKPPLKFIEDCDIFLPGRITDFSKALSGFVNVTELLISQATTSEGCVAKSAAWCDAIRTPFFRFNPMLSENVILDCKDDRTLINMLFETQVYIHLNQEKVVEASRLLL